MFFENSSLKGISGQNMSDPLKWSSTDDSRFLQAAVLNFFNAENHGKRPSHPLVTTAPKRQRQKTDFPESKASFVVYEVKKWLKGNVGPSRCSFNTTKVFMRRSLFPEKKKQV